MTFFPKTLFLALALVSPFFLPQVQARPILGDIDFSGVVTFDTMSLNTATRITNWNTSLVTRDTGDFSGIALGTHSTMSAWTFSPSTATPGLWTVGGFTFNLSSSAVVSQSAVFLNITGIGTISGNGFDPTPGLWSFTSSNSNGTNNATFSFQTNTVAVPEGSTVALLATGSVALAALRHFGRKAKTSAQS